MVPPAATRKKMYQAEIQQMMYVFGEVQDPLDETTALVEDIVRTQIVQLISQCVYQSQRRGSRYLAAEDLIFLIRHDRSKVNRLRSFLSWKDVRKNVKGEKGPTMDDDLLEEDTDKAVKVKKLSVTFSWDHVNSYTTVLEDDDEDVDEDDREAYEDQSNRLELADKLTRVMTQDEYIYYSECRQASFTYKKLKKFREWTEMSKFYDSKANSDIIDSLGFLCYEAVSKITETSLMVKRKEDERIALNPTVKHGKIFKGLFEKPISNQRPIQPRHVMEAYRLLQAQSHPFQLFQRTISRNALSIF